MKFVLAHFSTAKEEWSEQACALYQGKLAHFVDFEIVALKPKKSTRDEQATRLRVEGEVLEQFLKDGDQLVIFDERGRVFTSEKFAAQIRQLHESGKRRVIFVIGGAYGLSDEIKKRAQVRLSLAPFVMNHLVAQVVALEQIYRSFTILKGLPYHNAGPSSPR